MKRILLYRILSAVLLAACGKEKPEVPETETTQTEAALTTAREEITTVPEELQAVPAETTAAPEETKESAAFAGR